MLQTGKFNTHNRTTHEKPTANTVHPTRISTQVRARWSTVQKGNIAQQPKRVALGESEQSKAPLKRRQYQNRLWTKPGQGKVAQINQCKLAGLSGVLRNLAGEGAK